MGAAYASVSSYIFAFLISLALAWKVFPLPWNIKDFSKVVFITAAMALALWPTLKYQGTLVLGIQCVIGLVIVVTLTIMFNLLDIRTLLVEKIKRNR
jgi:hypothetical protein